MRGWQRNLSFFAVHVSRPCLVHPALLEKPKALSVCMTLFRDKKSHSVSQTALLFLVGYVIERLLLMTVCCLFRRTAVIPAGVRRE